MKYINVTDDFIRLNQQENNNNESSTQTHTPHIHTVREYKFN